MTMYIPKTKDKNTVFCNFISVSDNFWKCSKCNNIISISDGGSPPVIPCKGAIKDFINSKTHDKQLTNLINYRYGICKSCTFFKNNICSKCGCLISTIDNYANKLADKKDKCPEGKW